MGAYCRYCDRRCFLPRTLPADAKGDYAGMTIHMATCTPGMAHDREATGHDHTTAINPVTGLSGGAR
jgi:hypothetical protein